MVAFTKKVAFKKNIVAFFKMHAIQFLYQKFDIKKFEKRIICLASALIRWRYKDAQRQRK